MEEMPNNQSKRLVYFPPTNHITHVFMIPSVFLTESVHDREREREKLTSTPSKVLVMNRIKKFPTK